jgi:hypothetical protein
MRNPPTKFPSATTAGLAASLALISIPHGDAQARECLSAPKGAVPAGSHWYYRIDHATKRNCWYVRGVDEKSAAPARAATADATPDDDAAATPAPAKDAVPVVAPKPSLKPSRPAASPLQPSVANARAEWQSPPPPAPMRDVTNAAASPSPASQASTSEMSPPAAEPQDAVEPPPSQTAAPQSWPLDRRLSDTAASDSSAATAAATTKLRSAMHSTLTTGAVSAPAEAAAPGSSASTRSSWTTLVGALLAALAFAGLVVGGLVKFSPPKPATRKGGPAPWRNVVPSPAGRVDPDLDLAPPMQSSELPSWIKIARARLAEKERSDELEQLLARAQKQHPAPG